jgi:hypothetical protein
MRHYGWVYRDWGNCHSVGLQMHRKSPEQVRARGCTQVVAFTQASKTERCGVSGDGGAAQSGLYEY